jgi:hypothetical protein
MPSPLRRELWWNKKLDLYTLLLKFIGSKAGNLRDIIYALLSICSDNLDNSAINVDYKKEPKQVVRDAALFLFDLSDCFYSTVYGLIGNVTYLNSNLFLRKVQLEDKNRVRNFLRLRGGTIKVTEEVVRAAAENSKSGPQIIKLLLDWRGDEVKITYEVRKAAAEDTISGRQMTRLLGHWRRDEARIAEEVVEAAVGDLESEEQVIKLILER